MNDMLPVEEISRGAERARHVRRRTRPGPGRCAPPRPRPGRTRGAVLLLVLGLAAFPGWVPAASAHTDLVSATPADRSVVGSATRVTLTFSEALREPSVVVVTGPDGGRVDVGPTRLSAATATVRVRLSERGRHTVGYRVVSADGHPVTGRTTFTFRPVADPPSASASRSPSAPSGSRSASSASSASSGPASGLPSESTGADTAAPSPASASGPADNGPGAGTVTGWTAAGVLVLGAGALVLVRGRRGTSGSGSGGRHR